MDKLLRLFGSHVSGYGERGSSTHKTRLLIHILRIFGLQVDRYDSLFDPL